MKLIYQEHTAIPSRSYGRWSAGFPFTSKENKMSLYKEEKMFPLRIEWNQIYSTRQGNLGARREYRPCRTQKMNFNNTLLNEIKKKKQSTRYGKDCKEKWIENEIVCLTRTPQGVLISLDIETVPLSHNVERERGVLSGCRHHHLPRPRKSRHREKEFVFTRFLSSNLVPRKPLFTLKIFAQILKIKTKGGKLRGKLAAGCKRITVCLNYVKFGERRKCRTDRRTTKNTTPPPFSPLILQRKMESSDEKFELGFSW